MQQGNVDVRVFQEMKLIRGIQANYREGYAIWVTDAPGGGRRILNEKRTERRQEEEKEGCTCRQSGM